MYSVLKFGDITILMDVRPGTRPGQERLSLFEIEREGMKSCPWHVYCVKSCTKHMSLNQGHLDLTFLFVVRQVIKNDQSW